MRFDKLTTKFQQALADAQSLALGNDNGSIERLPKVEGAGGEIGASRELSNLLNLTDKEAVKRGDQFIASELFLLALADDKGDTGRILKENGLTRQALESA